MNEFFNAIPPLLIHFVVTLAFSFVVGLEFRRYQHTNNYRFHFGSTRTVVLVGLLGLILYNLDPTRLLFVIGLVSLSSFLMIYYWHLATEKLFSLFSALLTLLIYLIGPIATDFPNWFLVLFIVVLILILSEKPLIHRISDQLANEEMVTLAKFLIISGVVLPLLPDQPIAAMLPVTYYKVWFAVIIVSGFSYLSYLCNSYFFKSRSLLITGFLSGLYSSTVATIVISRRAKNLSYPTRHVSAALIIATIMMYLRLLCIIYLFDSGAGNILLVPFLGIILLSLIVVLILLHFQNHSSELHPTENIQHPLELSTAILFAALFVLFTFLTQWVINQHGSHGLNFLAIIVGFTDIDPFILSLLSGKFHVNDATIVSAVILATGSNNLLKATYALALARNRSVYLAAIWLSLLFLVSIIYAYQLG